MAKYTVNHQCGHTEIVELFGKETERQRKIAWMETTDCKECWVAKQRETRNNESYAAEAIENLDGDWIAVTKGNTYAIKDQLKAIGCKWIEYGRYSPTSGSQLKAWAIKIDPKNDETGTLRSIKKLMGLGITNITFRGIPLSENAMKKIAELD